MDNQNKQETIEVNCLKKIEIKNLWGKYDLEWELDPDINVLSGANGSGKSTILDLIFSVFSKNFDIVKNTNIFDYAIFCCNNKNNPEQEDIEVLVKYDTNTNKLKYDYKTNDILVLNFAFTRLLDIPIYPLELLQQQRQNQGLKSHLDFGIENLQKRYLNYQINLNKHKDKLLENSQNIKEDIEKLNEPRKYFLELLNTLFESGAMSKKIDLDNNEISFILENGEKISAFELSTGEKTMLIILMSVLCQDFVPTVHTLDEPEVSLHFEWQKNLIQYIRNLNPNAQVIIATHSPAIIMRGYMDKVTNMHDILKPHKIEEIA